VQVAAGREHTVGLKSDGTVVAVGNNWAGQLNVASWTDIVHVAAGSVFSLGLKSNGTLVGAGTGDQCILNVDSWADIVQVAADGHTVGLKSDGTAVAVGMSCSASSVSLLEQHCGGGRRHVSQRGSEIRRSGGGNRK